MGCFQRPFENLSVIDHEECESAERIKFFVGLIQNAKNVAMKQK